MRVLATWILLLLSSTSLAGTANLTGVHLQPGDGFTAVVLDFTGPVRYTLFTLERPHRVVLDLADARLTAATKRPHLKRTDLLRGVRTAPKRGEQVRVVLDVSREVWPRGFFLSGARGVGHSLVIELREPVLPTAKREHREPAPSTAVARAAPPRAAPEPGTGTSGAARVAHGGVERPASAAPVPALAAAAVAANGAVSPARLPRTVALDHRAVSGRPSLASPTEAVMRTSAARPASVRQPDVARHTPTPEKAVPRRASRDIVIAIDAGHGGKDPGAIGPDGVQEKDVTLAIARELARLVAREPGMRPVLIRDSDYFISLRGRTRKARRYKADLFVSIHADAVRDRSVQGSSVYILSERGASSEAARWLAARENAADLVGGVSLDDKADDLARVLLDLSQDAALEASFGVASRVLTSLHGVGMLSRPGVERAAFLVLKSPDIPSILVETAFISNPEEERKLSTRSHQHALAQAILEGIRNHFVRNPPPGTLLAMRES